MDFGRRQETRESETKDVVGRSAAGLVCFVCSRQFSLSPKSTECPSCAPHSQGIYNTAEKPKLRKPDLLQRTHANLPDICPCSYLYYNGQQTNLLSTLEGDGLSQSSKRFTIQIHIFEETVWNKSHQHLSSQEVQKRERSLENSFPTDTAPVPSWRAGTRNHITTGLPSS